MPHKLLSSTFTPPISTVYNNAMSYIIQRYAGKKQEIQRYAGKKQEIIKMFNV